MCIRDSFGAVRRNGGTDLLIQINPASGTFVPGAFGGSDYAEIPAVAGLNAVDDIAVCPTACTLYGVFNEGTTTQTNHLATINPLTGASADIGDTGVTDIEGLTCDSSGILTASTGGGGTNPNSFFELNIGNLSLIHI